MATMGIIGFGRSGRLVFRAAVSNPSISLKAVNNHVFQFSLSPISFYNHFSKMSVTTAPAQADVALDNVVSSLPNDLLNEAGFVEDKGTFLEVHAYLHRGQLLNAYEAKMLKEGQDVDFGHGILNKGKGEKREKRPLTQIEIMAAAEREKQDKKQQRKDAKEAKLAARKEKEEMAKFGDKKLSKKERRKLEQDLE